MKYNFYLIFLLIFLSSCTSNHIYKTDVDIQNKILFQSKGFTLIYDENDENFETINYDAVREVCLEHKPKMLLCGYSAYPRIIHFDKMRAVADECGAYLMCDIAHIAGLVAGGVHPSPFPHAHAVTVKHKAQRKCHTECVWRESASW